MSLIDSPAQLASALLVYLAGLFIALAVGKRLRIPNRRSFLLYVWHSLFCVFYAVYAITNGADALVYYIKAANGEFMLSVGTGAVVSIATLFVTGLNLSFLGACLLFNIFGSIGLLAFDASLRSATADKSRLIRRFATLIVLLPSISFWSGALGKDSLAFMATGLALWAAMNMKRRALLMAGAVMVMLLVRPHIAGTMVIALTGSLVIQKKMPLPQRLLLGGLALGATAAMIPFALNYAGVGEGAGADELVSYVEQRQSVNTQGGSSIDIASMSLPLQLYSYLFRPLPFEATSVFALAASADNMILLFLFIAGGMKMLKRRKHASDSNRAFLWLYSILAWVILSMTTANLGISVRQKWMFAPMLIFLFISLLGKSRQRRQAAAPARKLPPSSGAGAGTRAATVPES
ncbi:hypothetical protein [Pollutimonas bauzanensis]|uniref:Dolichyl-phosphate-mannose-protein mannosyltransferase n=1 Tax=Pollutimonas bauzanensis TaxID=658167 RepID=A0A1M5X4Y9_9BURK|nr:hypothetical protein [Pollutimonas bauzanensis]SHH94578.1 hypothetical protein SAMN04488135_106136 [Pollutimonas bauzanensis]